MNLFEIKKKAEEQLISCKEKWFMATFICILLEIISVNLDWVINLPYLNLMVLTVIVLMIVRGLKFGLKKMYVRKRRKTDLKVSYFIEEGFSEMLRAWSISFWLLPKFLVSILCILCPAIIDYYKGKSILADNILVDFFAFVVCIYGIWHYVPLYFQYRYTDIEAIKNPQLKAREIVENTGEIMEYQKKNSFKLDFIFIPSYLLVLLLVLILDILCGMKLHFLTGDIHNFLDQGMGGAIFIVLVALLGITLIKVKCMMMHIVFYESLKGDYVGLGFDSIVKNVHSIKGVKKVQRNKKNEYTRKNP